MKINHRLSKLEAAQNLGSVEADDLLIELVGRRDAVFWPTRNPKQLSAAQSRQRAYLAGTIGIGAKADGIAEWKPAHTARRALIESGRINAVFGSGQVSSVFITEQGDADARAMIGPHIASVRQSLSLLARILRHDGKPFLGRRWMSESELFDKTLTGNPETWSQLTELILPLLVRGYVVCSCDTNGRAYYSADEVDLNDDEPHSDCQRIDGAVDRYLSAFNSELRSLALCEDPGTGVSIPIPASGW